VITIEPRLLTFSVNGDEGNVPLLLVCRYFTDCELRTAFLFLYFYHHLGIICFEELHV